MITQVTQILFINEFKKGEKCHQCSYTTDYGIDVFHQELGFLFNRFEGNQVNVKYRKRSEYNA
jgi:hypothetical protein